MTWLVVDLVGRFDGQGDSLKVYSLDSKVSVDVTQQVHSDISSQLCKHILTVSSFNKSHLHQIFNLAHHYRLCVMRERPLDHILKGKVRQLHFY